jgi:hypothetical protein
MVSTALVNRIIFTGLFISALLLCAFPLSAEQDGVPFPVDEEACITAVFGGDVLTNFLNILAIPEESKRIILERVAAFEEMQIHMPWHAREKRDASLRGYEYAVSDGPVLAGAAEVAFTNFYGAPLAGYGDRFRLNLLPSREDPLNFSHFYAPHKGVHDPLMFSVVVLDTGNQRVAIAGVDNVGFSQGFYTGLLDRCGHLGIEQGGIIVGASHTHSGMGAVSPLLGWMIGTVDLFVPMIYNQMLNSMAEAVEAACANLEPARIGFGAGEVYHISRNRRSDHPQGHIDPGLAVIRVDRLDGTPLAVVFNFALHLTQIRGDNLRYSADIGGYTRAFIKGALGNDVVSVFLNGTEGDIDPTGGQGNDNFEKARDIGVKLGTEIIAVHTGIMTDETVSIRTAHSVVDLPDPKLPLHLWVEPPLPFERYLPVPGLFESTATNFSAVEINNALLVTIPGEMTVDNGVAIRNGTAPWGYDDVLLVGLSNGHLGYITTEDEFRNGGYESSLTLFGPETGRLIVNAVLDTAGLLNPY